MGASHPSPSQYLSGLFQLEGKVAVLTGAGGLLCGAMARGLGAAGCKVAVCDRELEKAQVVAAEIEKAGGQAIPIKMEVVHRAEHESALATVLERWGKVDILVNGAGINAPTPVLDISEEEWDSIMAVHLKGTLFGCQIFGRQMLKQGKGSIINVSSASAGPPLSKAFTYSVAKAGIYNLTQNIAREWGPQGVRVNALRPGFFPTQWSRKNFITPERERAILGHTPMARYGEAEELIGATLWLASEAAGFVTGAMITVDGGFTAMTI